MKTILVTGGAGFIGSHFIMHLLANGNNVLVINLDLLTYAGNLENLRTIENNPNYRFIKGDICDKRLLERLFSEQHIDAVVNFAAESHVDRSIDSPEVFVSTNVSGTLTLLNAAKTAWTVAEDTYRNGVKFLQISTDEVYGDLGSEGFFTEKTPLDPHSPYSASKASADLLVKAWSDTYKLPVNITRCSNNYGPYQFPEKLIPLIINNALEHKDLPIYGDGLQVRDWLYVEDHCTAINLVLKKGKAGEVYNIGGHNERTNIEIVRTIINFIKENVDVEVNEDLIKHVDDRKGHDRRYGIDSGKIVRELGWQPRTSFEDGINKTIQWYIDNGKWISNVIDEAYRNYYESMYRNR